jgi:Zn-finger nucleic acid-binding protein
VIVICPKCQNVMTTLDKNGVHIEQCSGCRGIFLDRGELEQIVSAENSFYASAPPPPYTPPSPPPPPPTAPYHGNAPAPGGYYGDSPRPYRGAPTAPGHHGGYYGDSPRPYHGGYHDSPRPYGHRRRKSFLESLFD